MLCDQPFDCGNNTKEGKRHTRDWLKRLFAMQERVSVPHVTVEAGHCVTPMGSQSGPQSSLYSGSLDRTKRAGGRPQVFHDDGCLSVQLTDKILGQLNSHKHLEDNEIDVLIVLLKNYPGACAQSSIKQTWWEGIEELQI